MKAHEILDYLLNLETGWVDKDNTVDTFKAGNKDTEVTGIAVGWKAHRWALEEAHAKECNLFVGHEPLYYDHWDKDDSFLRYPGVKAKHEWIDAHDMAIVRCHDTWDQFPELGIPDSWAKIIGFENPLPESDGLFKVFDVSGRTAGDVARQVAGAVKKLGGGCTQFVGSDDTEVTHVVIGTGAITPLTTFLDRFNADIAVVTDDGYTFWRDGALAIDTGLPLIVVNHCVAEDYGMALMAEHLKQMFPGIPVYYIPQSHVIRAVETE